MAAGVPAIASDVGGIPELLGADALFPADDPRALAEKLRELIGSRPLRARLAESGHENATTYTRRKMRARRQRFYEQLISRTGSQA